MCGIAGIFDIRGVTKDQIERMNSSLAHRGPDEQGVLLSKNIAFGHRRLSIIDLSNGQQPMQTEDGSIWIVFNGEIYNYQEIRETLSDSYNFKTHSDTEVILRLYEVFGEKCLNRLRGMFAFTIYDFRENVIFAARDHFGQKPYYYWHHENGFAFASEIKALLALNPDLKKMDPEALYEYLTVRIVTPPRSMFKQVKKLPPAHYLKYKDGNLEIKPFWNLNYKIKNKGGLNSILDELDDAFSEAVKYHLVSDVPVGSFLSGGVDSGLIVAKMAQLSDQAISTFTGDVDYKGYGELAYAKIVSEKYHTHNHILNFKPSLVNSLTDILWHLDEPSDSLSVAMFYIAKLARKHVKVVLGGDGGDELFGGYNRYYGNQFAQYFSLIPVTIRKHIIGKILEFLPDGNWYQSIFHQAKWLNQISLSEGSQRYADSLSYFYFSDQYKERLYTKSFRQEISGFDPCESIKQHFDCANADELLDKMLSSDSAIRMPDHPVMVLDRMTMAHGLESRSPFLDHKLAEFCATIPPQYKVRGFKRRYIQTKLAERYLPKNVIYKKKQGFASPITYMLADEYSALYKTFLKHSRLVEEGILQGELITKMVDEHLSSRADHGQRLWLLTNAELWYRMFIDGNTKEELRLKMEHH